MGHHIIKEVTQEKFEFTGRSKMIAILLFVVGAILATVGAMDVKKHWSENHTVATEEAATETPAVEEHHSTLASAQDAGHAEPTHSDEHATEAHSEDAGHAVGGHHEKPWTTRLWANLLMNSYYFLLFAVGALFFMAVNYVANAGWAVMLKRIMEAMSGYLLIGFLILFTVIVLGKDQIYHWVQYFAEGNTSADAGYDRILESKSWLLNNTSIFFFIPFVFLVWYGIRFKLRSNSLKEDEQGGITFFKNSIRWSAGFIFFFAFSFSALAWLIIMSIDAHWYSTMFSVYNFAVAFVTSLAMMMMILQYLKSKGYMEMVSDEVVHDLGKFMFAFCVFWGYIFVGQWLLIWYANLPEETVYFNARLTPYFKPMFRLNILMNFLFPFLILMMRNAKRKTQVLLIAGAIILVGHWLDMFLMVMPGTVGEKAGIGMLEIGTTMAFAGLFIYVVLNSLSKANLYTANHPYILESANHEVGP
jgi:hypothetical protein